MKSLHLLSLLGTVALSAASFGTLGCGGDSGTGTGGSGTSSGSAGGGTGGSGGHITPDPFPVDENTWTFVPIPGAKCIDDTDTGIGVNTTSASEDVILYLEGGNACFNQVSCAITANTDGYDKAKFDADAPGLADTPLFDRKTSALKDYNFVFVPYCTGDVHAGDATGDVGGAMRNFHGKKNMELYLERVHAAFPNAKRVIMSGSSAGGFGAAVNYPRTAETFPNVPVMLIDDSGPPMGEEYVAPCLQKFFVDTWGLDKGTPSDCSDCVKSNGVFMEPLVAYIKGKYADRRLSIVSSSRDATIARFWGYGENAGVEDCSQIQTIPFAYDGARYAEGLQDLRDRIVGDEKNFKMYLIDSAQDNGDDETTHVWLDNDPDTVVSHGVTLSTWFDQMSSGDAAWANVPKTGE